MMIVYSRQGRILAFSSKEGITVWGREEPPETHLTVIPLEAQTMRVVAMCFTPKGKRLVTAHETYGISIWGTKREEGRLLQRIPYPQGTLNLAICPSRLAFAAFVQSGDDSDASRYISIWEEATGCWVRWYRIPEEEDVAPTPGPGGSVPTPPVSLSPRPRPPCQITKVCGGTHRPIRNPAGEST
jgi:hypothetical protein